MIMGKDTMDVVVVVDDISSDDSHLDVVDYKKKVASDCIVATSKNHYIFHGVLLLSYGFY